MAKKIEESNPKKVAIVIPEMGKSKGFKPNTKRPIPPPKK